MSMLRMVVVFDSLVTRLLGLLVRWILFSFEV